MAGRWYALPPRDSDPTRRAAAWPTRCWAARVVTRGAVVAEAAGQVRRRVPVLAALEERGVARREYFVEGLGAAQFAVPGAVDRLRTLAGEEGGDQASAVVLAATGPANPYGARCLAGSGGRLRRGAGDCGRAPGGRKAGALVVLVHGELWSLCRARQPDRHIL
jgi:ATP-dependent Lhr-like helicase